MSYILSSHARAARIEEFNVEILYKKLWKLLIDRQMTQTEMRKAAGISSSTLATMNKNQPVTTAVLEKIPRADNDFRPRCLANRICGIADCSARLIRSTRRFDTRCVSN